ncbi:hypothetical protein SMD22_01305 (plasmid) [Brevibacillus halotolerans]|nr:hypothetical protein SMD22_01305 [Brevibacillus halotolerans]
MELLLAIPILGGVFILSNGWAPLFIAGILHAVVAVFFLANKQFSITGNVVGIIGALLGVIPFVGWFFHMVAAFILLIESICITRKKSKTYTKTGM